jgi:uncharacterized membrane protein
MPTSGMSDFLAGYPHWLVVALAALLAVVALWVLLKLVKAALWILFYGIIAAAVLCVVWYFLG